MPCFLSANTRLKASKKLNGFQCFSVNIQRFPGPDMRFTFCFGVFGYADGPEQYVIKVKNSRNPSPWYDFRKGTLSLRLAVFLPSGISN